MILALAPVAVFADGETDPTEPPETAPVSAPVTAKVFYVTSDGMHTETVEYQAGENFEGATLTLNGGYILNTKEFERQNYTLNAGSSKTEGIVASSDGGLNVYFTLVYDAPAKPELANYTISYVYDDFGLTPEASVTVKEGDSHTVSNAHKDWPGYKFLGWKIRNTDTVVTVLNNVTSDIELVACFVKDPVAGKYTVEHYWENVDGKGYTLHETEIKSGVADGETVIAAKSHAKDYVGLTYSRAEGTSVADVYAENINGAIKVYYTRNIYNVTYKVDGKPSGDAEACKYGQQVTLRETPKAKKGYTFVGWDTSELVDGATMPAKDVVISGTMEAGTGAVYTVNIYRQNVKGDYELYSSQKRTGVVDSITKVTAASVAGYVLQPFTNKTIKADGSTVISIYYEMTDEMAAALIAANKGLSKAPANNTLAPAANNTLQLGALELPEDPADAVQPDEVTDGQDTANIGDEETPLAPGSTGMGFSIIPFIIIGLLVVAAAIYVYIRNKKQENEA